MIKKFFKFYSIENIEKRGLIKNLKQSTQTENHGKKLIIISYTSEFDIEDFTFKIVTQKPLYLNNDDDIVVNATAQKNGDLKINFYKNFTSKEDNFSHFISKQIQVLVTLAIIFASACIMAISQKLILKIVGIFLVFLLIFSSIFAIKHFLKLNKSLKLFKSLH